jgi:hypothetical protein
MNQKSNNTPTFPGDIASEWWSPPPTSTTPPNKGVVSRPYVVLSVGGWTDTIGERQEDDSLARVGKMSCYSQKGVCGWVASATRTREAANPDALVLVGASG